MRFTNVLNIRLAVTAALAALSFAPSSAGQQPAGQQPQAPTNNAPATQQPQPGNGQPNAQGAGAQAPAAGGAPTVTPTTGNPNPRAPVRLDGIGQTVLSPRIRSITKVSNLMPYKLTGVGLVSGLPGTGASDRGTRQAILNFIRQHDLNLTIGDVTGGSTALVSLSCEMPPFSKEGTQLDVKCQILSDATSLRGGVLQLAALKGVDNQIYAVASGPLDVAGYTAQGQNAQITKNPTAVADLMNGGRVIKEYQNTYFTESGALELRLLNPSPFNAESVAAGVKTALDGMGMRVAAVDAAMVRIEAPLDQCTNENALRILGLIGNVRVAVENPTKVTIDQVRGTVIAGEGVLISPCVVGLSELTIAIVEEDFISQPNAFAQGSSERVGRTRVEAETNSTELQPIGGGGATVADLLQNLKTLGMTPAQLVQVFVALDKGGFLHADLEVQ